MTKEITKAIILQEMQDKLKLREFAPANFLFDETVVPIYNIESHLQEWVTASKSVSITSADGFLFFTVPENERWFLQRYMLIFGATGAHKASGMYTLRKATPTLMYLDLKLGSEVTYLINVPNIVTLNAGDELWVYIDTYVSTQSLYVYIDYMREEIR